VIELFVRVFGLFADMVLLSGDQRALVVEKSIRFLNACPAYCQRHGSWIYASARPLCDDILTFGFLSHLCTLVCAIETYAVEAGNIGNFRRNTPIRRG
jgi:hypothetical protein